MVASTTRALFALGLAACGAAAPHGGVVTTLLRPKETTVLTPKNFDEWVNKAVDAKKTAIVRYMQSADDKDCKWVQKGHGSVTGFEHANGGDSNPCSIVHKQAETWNYFAKKYHGEDDVVFGDVVISDWPVVVKKSKDWMGKVLKDRHEEVEVSEAGAADEADKAVPLDLDGDGKPDPVETHDGEDEPAEDHEVAADEDPVPAYSHPTNTTFEHVDEAAVKEENPVMPDDPDQGEIEEAEVLTQGETKEEAEESPEPEAEDDHGLSAFEVQVGELVHDPEMPGCAIRYYNLNQPPSHRMPWSPSCAEMLVKGHMATAGMVGDGDGVDVGEHEIALEGFIEGAKDMLGSEMDELEHLDQL